MPFIVGETIGQYQLVEQLGQGGMATVFKAYHARLDRYVAIKALHPAFTQDPNFLARFQREAQLVARLEHPNIVPIYDFSEYEGRPYLVMKYIEGETLKSRLINGNLDARLIIKIVEGVGSALDYAHKQGILHRDVKPSNVLLAEDGRIYLADFGLARIAEAGESTISTDMMLGTPQYISPEQAMGRRDLDSGTDIYSFGVLVYEMVVGKVPFSADTPYSIIHDHIYAPLPMPRKENPEVSEAMERVLLKALAKNREDRYETVSDMVAACRQAMDKSFQTRVLPMEEVTSDSTGQAIRSSLQDSPQTSQSEVQDAAPESGVSLVSEEETPPEAKPERKRWPIIIGVVALLCVCLGGLALADRWSKRGGIRGNALPTGEPALLTEGPVNDRVVQAKKLVDENPDDPIAHLDLAVAFWEADRPVEAERALIQAVEKAGEDDEFYIIAGDKLMSLELYPPAARMYMRAMTLSPGLPRDDLIDNLHQSLYLGAEDEEVKRMIGELPPERKDRQFFDVVRARGFLLAGDVDAAREIVERLQREGSEIPELKLLECELLVSEGQSDLAREKLATLIEDRFIPDWIRVSAEAILSEIER